jgi:hypothetical protein
MRSFTNVSSLPASPPTHDTFRARPIPAKAGIGLRTLHHLQIIEHGTSAARLPGVDMMPNLKSYAVWRGTYGANVAPLTRQAPTFINAILNHLSCEEALTLALWKNESVDPLHFITHEVITESFAKVVVKRCDKNLHDSSRWVPMNLALSLSREKTGQHEHSSSMA